MNNLEILEWNYILQHKLDQMNSKDFNKFMKGKAIRYEGKLYSIGGKNEQGKNNKAGRKENRTTKGSNKQSEVH